MRIVQADRERHLAHYERNDGYLEWQEASRVATDLTIEEITDRVAVLEDRGRLTLAKFLRERYERYPVVERHEGITLVPVADDPLAALRKEFADGEQSAAELRDQGRQTALEEAGR